MQRLAEMPPPVRPSLMPNIAQDAGAMRLIDVQADIGRGDPRKMQESSGGSPQSGRRQHVLQKRPQYFFLIAAYLFSPRHGPAHPMRWFTGESETRGAVPPPSTVEKRGKHTFCVCLCVCGGVVGGMRLCLLQRPITRPAASAAGSHAVT